MSVEFLIGVDGGGTGTRVLVTDHAGRELIRSSGGPSGLGLGIAAAWQAIIATIESAFMALQQPFQPQRCAIGLGLAGVHNVSWAKAFLEAAPTFAAIQLDTDGFTTLLGAHDGQPGVVIAIGTGCAGEVWQGGEQRHTVSAWGFPCGDEGSGAWIGMKAAQLAQKALDGRTQRGSLANAVIQHFGGNTDAAFTWLGQATQTNYAQLSPLVLSHATTDPAADTILRQAGDEIAAVAQALDPEARLPLALCGGLADALRPWLPAELLKRARQPLGDSANGALHLIRGNR